MNYAGHLTGGLITAGIVGGTSFILSGLHPVVGAVCAATTLIMALYPDYDIASTPSKQAFIVGIPAVIILALMHHLNQAILVLLFISVPKMFPHRGFVHTLRFGMIASFCWYSIVHPFIHVNLFFMMTAGMVGYLTHLILDRHVKI